MDKSQIFLFTSDKQEGWGAVVNEAMNSGCCVIAPAEAGAVPYLINNGDNGFVFRSDDPDELAACCIQAARYPEIRKSCGEKAFETVRYTWNASVAAERLTDLARMLMEEWGIEEGRCGMPSKVPGKAAEIPWKTGPCSIETVRDESVVSDNALKYRS